MNKEQVNEALYHIMGRAKVPPCSRHAHADYDFMVVRDSLIQLGVNLKRAESLVRKHAGNVEDRLFACVEHLQ